MIDLVKNYSSMARRSRKSVIRELLKLTNDPSIISFAGGLPDPGAFPYDIMEEITIKVIREHGDKALQYGATEGNPLLKQALVELSKEEGEIINPDNIMITTASQQALDLLGRVFIDPSDPVLVELPSYVGALQAFSAFSAKLIGVESDDNGIKTDDLEIALKKLRKDEEHYKFLYLVPDFQNPSGNTLSTERRERLIELSEEYQILIVEDSPYRELRFEGQKPPSMYSMSKYGNVLSLKTFSKVFVPGLRLGWIVGPENLIKKFSLVKQSCDLCTSEFSQLIAYEFLKGGYLKPHVEKVNKIYKAKRDLMLKTLQEEMPEEVKWTHPEGGLFLWLKAPERLDLDELFPKAVENKVAYVIGSAFHCNGRGHNTARLNFSYPNHEQIVEGIKRLAKAFKQELTK